MHKLKSDIIHALQGVQMPIEKLVELSDICDDYVKTHSYQEAFENGYHEGLKKGLGVRGKYE